MRKQVFGRKFKRDKNERKALFNGLISAMISKGEIKTTEEKAKSIKSDLDKLVTKAKKGGENAKRNLQKDLKPFEIDKMINQIAPGFKNRQGGYTRIIKTGRRFNDDASMVVMQWTEMEAVVAPTAKVAKPAKKEKKKETAPKKAAKVTSEKTAVKKAPARKAAKK